MGIFWNNFGRIFLKILRKLENVSIEEKIILEFEFLKKNIE